MLGAADLDSAAERAGAADDDLPRLAANTLLAVARATRQRGARGGSGLHRADGVGQRAQRALERPGARRPPSTRQPGAAALTNGRSPTRASSARRVPRSRVGGQRGGLLGVQWQAERASEVVRPCPTGTTARGRRCGRGRRAARPTEPSPPATTSGRRPATPPRSAHPILGRDAHPAHSSIAVRTLVAPAPRAAGASIASSLGRAARTSGSRRGRAAPANLPRILPRVTAAPPWTPAPAARCAPAFAAGPGRAARSRSSTCRSTASPAASRRRRRPPAGGQRFSRLGEHAASGSALGAAGARARPRRAARWRRAAARSSPPTCSTRDSRSSSAASARRLRACRR